MFNGSPVTRQNSCTNATKPLQSFVRLSHVKLFRSLKFKLMRGDPMNPRSSACSTASRSLASMSPVTDRQSAISVAESGADSGLHTACKVFQEFIHFKRPIIK